MSVTLQENTNVKFLRKTKSVCPVCMNTIEACIVEKNGLIFMHKICLSHGKFTILISEFPDDYKEMSNFYFHFIPVKLQQREYYLNATNQCNIGCPICFLKYHDTVFELSLDCVKKASRVKNVQRFTFSHGEPTASINLFEMIKILKLAHKIVNIHTNGTKIADFQYALSLKSAGINQVSIQFDGFNEEIYKVLRGEKLLDLKLKALNNLKKLSIPVTLNVTIAKGVNEYEVGRIFDYAVKEEFVKDISFITYSHYDSSQKGMDKYIMPDELLAYIERHSAKVISRENIILFQKLFYAYISAFQKSKCFYYYHFLVVRMQKSYLPINEFINLQKVSRALDAIKRRRKKLTRLSLLGILCSSLKIKSLLLLPYGFLTFVRGGYPRKPGRLLAITFATICDPYKYDSDVAENCGQGIITSENIYESYGTYLMGEIRKYRQNL